MVTTKQSDRFPLPRHWSRQVRSAIVHAVSMANVAFTIARSRAEHQFDARVRLQAENDRLHRELSVLREEARIKDARMECLPAHRRPHHLRVESEQNITVPRFFRGERCLGRFQRPSASETTS